MGDDKKTEDLEDVDGGMPRDSILDEADGGAFPTAVNAEDPLKDVDGGPINNGGAWTGT